MLLLLLPLLTIVSIGKSSSEPRQFWITKVGQFGDESFKVQAILVKDEEVAAVGCKAASRNTDVRYSTKRYLMCAGSILTRRYILTSASCIHEATHIRHNIRAPLAVMIAPFSDTAQVIKIAGYSIHPDHLVDPRNEAHALHNVAIAKLACSISKRNLHQVTLPVRPFIDQCAEETCTVTIIKEIGTMSFIMHEVMAEDIDAVREKRDSPDLSKRKHVSVIANETRFNNRDIKKVLQPNGNGTAARIIETTWRDNNGNSKYIEGDSSEIDRNADSEKSIALSQISNKKLVVRESHGMKGCPQTGTAVMSNRIQSAMVTVSCDDRQPEKPWQYTDLFDNVDWINQMIGSWKPNPTLPGCTTCIYNFFIDYNCKNRAQCHQDSGSNNGLIKIPQLQMPKCLKNHTDSKTPLTHNHSENNESQSVNRAYIHAINNLYLNKHNHDENDINNERVRSESISDGKIALPHRDVAETVKLRLLLQTDNPAPKDTVARFSQQSAVSEKTLVLDYKDNLGDLDPNYRKVKAANDNGYKTKDYADSNEYPGRTNRDYQPRYNRIKNRAVLNFDRESVEKLFADGRISSLSTEWAELYDKFLEEYKQSKAKIQRNVVKRAE